MARDEARVGALFDEKADSWSSKYAAGGSLVGRLDQFARELAPHAAAGAAVLDFGCGAGDLSGHLARCGYRVTGVDISEQMIDQARARHGSAATWLSLSPDWTRLPMADASFDAVVASSVLEYVPRLDDLLAEVARVLRPGGVFLATVPDVRSPVRRVEGVAQAFILPAVSGLRPVMPSRVRRYADYLELSRHRLSRAVWHALGRLAGLEPIEPAGAADVAPLTMLAFRRTGRD